MAAIARGSLPARTGNSAISTTPWPICSASTRCSSACRSSTRCAPTACRTAGSRSRLRATSRPATLAERADADASRSEPRSARRVVRRRRCTATSTRLPFDASSLDLVVLPHALELARDPHLALREVERVLVPEGRVVIVGFNPASLWGAAPAARALAPAPGAARGARAVPAAAPASSSATGACATGCACSASRSRPGASAATVPPVRRSAWLTRFELDGARRRALVAGVRRGLLRRRRQARARHAPGRAGRARTRASRRRRRPRRSP